MIPPPRLIVHQVLAKTTIEDSYSNNSVSTTPHPSLPADEREDKDWKVMECLRDVFQGCDLTSLSNNQDYLKVGLVSETEASKSIDVSMGVSSHSLDQHSNHLLSESGATKLMNEPMYVLAMVLDEQITQNEFVYEAEGSVYFNMRAFDGEKDMRMPSWSCGVREVVGREGGECRAGIHSEGVDLAWLHREMALSEDLVLRTLGCGIPWMTENFITIDLSGNQNTLLSEKH
ncbi:hypothetical protein BT96DRAFT_942848 [Gymnopus androsaceus JB14]|uniref:Uncharacterized protein n=1 Tax=Gymnopus androsaceus JB14 TaxID=1447944 RepID=A0A6A4H9D1_9AGAR|nr:hypothetical protein BT96DRAFT_942848 [Gymnopus androsaceus JB14]